MNWLTSLILKSNNRKGRGLPRQNFDPPPKIGLIGQPLPGAHTQLTPRPTNPPRIESAIVNANNRTNARALPHQDVRYKEGSPLLLPPALPAIPITAILDDPLGNAVLDESGNYILSDP